MDHRLLKPAWIILLASLSGSTLASAAEENVARSQTSSTSNLQAVAGYRVHTHDPCNRPLTRAWISSQQPDGSSWQRWASPADDAGCPIDGACQLSRNLRSISSRHILSSSIHAVIVDPNKKDLLVTGELLIGWQGGGCPSGLITTLGAFVWRLDSSGQVLDEAYWGPQPRGAPPTEPPRCFELCGAEPYDLFAGRGVRSTNEGGIVLSGLQRPAETSAPAATTGQRQRLFVATLSPELETLSFTNLDHDTHTTDEIFHQNLTLDQQPRSVRAALGTLWQPELANLFHEDQQLIAFDPTVIEGQAELWVTFKLGAVPSHFDSLSIALANQTQDPVMVEVGLWNWRTGECEIVATKTFSSRLSLSIPAPAELRPGGALISAGGKIEMRLSFVFPKSVGGFSKGASTALGGLDRIIIVSGPD